MENEEKTQSIEACKIVAGYILRHRGEVYEVLDTHREFNRTTGRSRITLWLIAWQGEETSVTVPASNRFDVFEPCPWESLNLSSRARSVLGLGV